MVAQFYAPVVGGEERMVEELARALTARGHEVAVATLRLGRSSRTPRSRTASASTGFPGSPPGCRCSSATRADATLRPRRTPRRCARSRQVVRAERPDVVHGHNWLAHAYLPLRSRSAAAYVLSLHDYSLVCATKRLVRLGEPCSGPGAVKCVRCASAQYGPARRAADRGADARHGAGAAARRRRLPAGERRRRAGLRAARRPHAVGGRSQLRRRRPARGPPTPPTRHWTRFRTGTSCCSPETSSPTRASGCCSRRTPGCRTPRRSCWPGAPWTLRSPRRGRGVHPARPAAARRAARGLAALHHRGRPVTHPGIVRPRRARGDDRRAPGRGGAQRRAARRRGGRRSGRPARRRAGAARRARRPARRPRAARGAGRRCGASGRSPSPRAA